jgi:sec-independent protein translocase protein TatA
MGSLSIWHWIIVIGVVLLLFGRGKISELMGDVAQGIKAFKKGMSEDEVAKADGTKTDPAKPDALKVIDNDNAGTAMKARADNERRVEGSNA